jgi:hypothetical protein
MCAKIATCAGRTRMRTTKIECALLVAVLAMFVPSFAHAETSGASGNAAGRRPSSTAVIGGPARYDAKHGAVIGGTVTGRKR